MYYLFTQNIEKFGIIKFQNYEFIQKFAIRILIIYVCWTETYVGKRSPLMYNDTKHILYIYNVRCITYDYNMNVRCVRFITYVHGINNSMRNFKGTIVVKTLLGNSANVYNFV